MKRISLLLILVALSGCNTNKENHSFCKNVDSWSEYQSNHCYKKYKTVRPIGGGE